MSWLVAGLGIVILVVVLLNWFTNARPQAVLGLGKWVVVGLTGLLVIGLVATGRFSFLWLAAMGLLPWIRRWRLASNLFKTMRGPSKGQSSTVRSRFLEMSLDHDNGDLDGSVVEGRFEGCVLSEMPEADLQALLDEIAPQDPKSAELLESYLDRTQPGDWRESWGRPAGSGEAGRENEGASDGPMAVDEARDILGVDEKATANDIIAAHRNLMKLNHPDHGGSTYLAAKINQAKDLLLDRGQRAG